MANYEFVDHLTEYMKKRVTRLVQNHRDSLPQELADLPDERIVALITDMATPVLRKIEDDAIASGIERAAGLIRYSKKGGKSNG